MTNKRKKYSKEFKQDAVRLYRTTDKTQEEIANDLGISKSILSKWNMEYDNPNSFPGHGNPIDKELFELKKELANVKEERDILKKALAIFSGRKKL